jgi:hypothetical protein
MALMGYAALTIVLYFLMAPLTVIGFIDKAIEVALIALLLDDAYLARSEPPEGTRGTHDRLVMARSGWIWRF